MRESGLDEAIRVAGGVGALARKLGISQPSVSNWSRIPAERVLAVEAATGVTRAALRPDLYEGQADTSGEIDEIDLARAREYGLLARLLAQAPTAQMLEAVAQLRGDPTPLGVAHAALAQAANAHAQAQLEREYFDLFIGIGRGEMLPYGSYYLTGFLHDRPLARLRADLVRFGIERAPGNCEPEDHAAILFEIMAGLIDGRLPAPVGADREIHEKHLAPWIDRFFADLERAESADFYRKVGMLGRVFMEIESEAFALPS
ncbi:MAG: molecular chaperone TorD family protein [Proteobacteria bacterium]|nr:molecular chaperone TorD family protein [Pseudomonadota bacterium]